MKFTHRTSTVPEHSLYNVMGAHLSNTAIISSHLEYFLAEIPILVQHLRGNALGVMPIKRSIDRWAINKANTLPLKFEVTDISRLLEINYNEALK